MVMTKSEALRILELRQGSTPEEIRTSYKRLALKWHPDKHNNSTESTKKFQEISEAYKRLTSKDDMDDIKISMADMFDLFAHIFFGNRGYFVNDHLFFSDDDDDDEDEYMYMNALSSDDEGPMYRTRQRHGKYSDLMASRVSKTAAAEYRREIRKKQNEKVPTGISEEEARKNAEELIKEEENMKKKAEKRRARKKRNRANRKQREKGQKADEQEAGNGDESEEEDQATEDRERRDSSKENKNPTNKENSARTNVTKNKKTGEDEESENERAHDETWDTSSAFFNHAARRGPVHTTQHTNNETTPATSSEDTSVYKNEHTTQETQSNHTRREESEKDLVEQSRHLAAIGNNEANEGNYNEAIDYFTQAISLHNRDFRFFGNRSYCYDRLGEYTKALQDAEVTIMLVPHWAKGYFRKGRALVGLKQYADAEKAFQHVLKLDKHCEDAKFELTRVRVQQLRDMGFGHSQSERAVRLYGTVHAALDAILSGKVKNLVANEDEMYVSDGEVEQQDNDARQRYPEPMASLWVGNIDAKQVTERQLIQLFSKFGTISLIRILPQSFCAFVNYENKESAAKALQSLQGYMIGGQNIIIRFQASDSKSSKNAAKPTGPVNGNECYFWRTTGCVYGDKCHYTHVPGNKGIDIEKVEQKYGKIKKR